MRNEQEVFDDLTDLCSKPGYVHAVAFISYKDNYVGYVDEVTTESMLSMFSKDRLIRTELCTLIGLLVKTNIDFTRPSPQTAQTYIERTYALLEELHQAMSGGLLTGLPETFSNKDCKPFSEGQVLREPIFYSGESAYSFQYRDLAVKKYAADSDWLEENKGFSIEAARDVVQAVQQFQNKHLTQIVHSLPASPLDEWTLLPGFTFEVSDISAMSKIDEVAIEQVLNAFALPDREHNQGFRSMHDFNVVCATPLLRCEDSFILFCQYNLVEALYDSPFFWMNGDPAYKDVAMTHRGHFTENFAHERLNRVFGDKRVYLNVDIQESKAKKAGEIDVLVLFGNRAIVLQAKSKRLTLESRRGNDQQIRDDFKKGVQDAYDQAYDCAQHLLTSGSALVTAEGQTIPFPKDLKQIYIFCVVSDHYPALSFQAREFLRFEKDDVVPPPFIMDVFTLDAMTEMLDSPLQFLSYMDRRTRYSEKLIAPDELTILSFHLKQNLWLDDKYDWVQLTDDISCDLDTAMMVRRDNIPGKRTPDGILTRSVGTTLWRILSSIERSADPGTLDFGFMLLTMSEESFKGLSRGIDALVQRTRQDRKHHDVSTASEVAGEGFTVHCNYDSREYAVNRLATHCELRKYLQKARRWFGICLHPNNAAIRFGMSIDYEWKHDPVIEEAAKKFVDRKSTQPSTFAPNVNKKIGRNDPCPCGSGKKYKKCCLT